MIRRIREFYFISSLHVTLGVPNFIDFQWQIFLAINVMLQLTQSVGNLPLTSEKQLIW